MLHRQVKSAADTVLHTMCTCNTSTQHNAVKCACRAVGIFMKCARLYTARCARLSLSARGKSVLKDFNALVHPTTLHSFTRDLFCNLVPLKHLSSIILSTHATFQPTRASCLRLGFQGPPTLLFRSYALLAIVTASRKFSHCSHDDDFATNTMHEPQPRPCRMVTTHDISSSFLLLSQTAQYILVLVPLRPLLFRLLSPTKYHKVVCRHKLTKRTQVRFREGSFPACPSTCSA